MNLSNLSTSDATKIITALKNGVVPNVSTDALLAGREHEIAEISRCLKLAEKDHSIFKLITGDYGSGKSMLLHKVHLLSIENNFVVSKIQLHQGFTLNKWEDMYRQVMHNLSIQNLDVINTGFEQIFDKWLTKLRTYTDSTVASKEIHDVTSAISQLNGDFTRAFLAYIRARIQNNGDAANAASSWIKGETNMPASLKAQFGIKGQIDRTNALSFLKTFVKLITLLNYQGLIILVDELESVMHQRSDIRQIIYENIRYLIDGCSSNEFVNCMFVFVGTNELFANEQRGIRSYEPLSQRLRSGFEHVPVEFRDLRQPVIQIPPLYKNDIDKLTNNIISIHSLAYYWNPNYEWETIQNWALFNCRQGNELKFPINTRKYIQSIVDILDSLQQGKMMSIFKIPLQIIESSNNSFSFTNKRS